MNPFGLYVGTLLLIIFYVMLIQGAVRLARKTPVQGSQLTLADYVFSAQEDFERGPFYTITIGFPFLITILPWLVEMPSFDSHTQIFVALLGFLTNYLVVIITVEVGLMYSITIKNPQWKDRLLVVIVLDVVSYVFVTLAKTRVDQIEKEALIATTQAGPAAASLVPPIDHFLVSGYAFSFFAVTAITSFAASLIIVLAVSRLGGQR